MRNSKGQFIKGHKSGFEENLRLGHGWNKGMKLNLKIRSKISKSLMGKKHSLETRLKMSKSHEGEKAWQWKGDKVGYSGLHDWVYKQLGKPQVCSHCNSMSNVQWANKSHEYIRDLEDWIQLCQSCHSTYDKDFHGARERFERRVSL